MGSDLTLSFSQSSAVALHGRQRHHRVEVSFKPLAILAAGAGGQTVPPPGQHKRAQQQRPHARRKDRVPRFNGELAVAELMRQANPPVRE